MGKVQVIKCKCGSRFAGCREPDCYTEKEWLKDLRKYVLKGYSVETMKSSDFKIEVCICEKEKADNNQTELFA